MNPSIPQWGVSVSRHFPFFMVSDSVLKYGLVKIWSRKMSQIQSKKYQIQSVFDGRGWQGLVGFNRLVIAFGKYMTSHGLRTLCNRP